MNTQLIISGIQCDNKSCDFSDESVQYKHYHLYINRPCPQCGQNLLTQEDLDKCQKLVKWTNRINKANKVLRWFNPIFYLRLFKIIKTDTTVITTKVK